MVFTIVMLVSALSVALFGLNHVYARSGETGIPDHARDNGIDGACGNNRNPHCDGTVQTNKPQGFYEHGADTGIFTADP